MKIPNLQDQGNNPTPSRVTLDNQNTPFDVKLYSPILNIGESDMLRLVNSDSEESTNEDTKHDYFDKGTRLTKNQIKIIDTPILVLGQKPFQIYINK